MRAVKNPFTLIAIAVMIIVFVVNGIMSWDGGPFRIMVWGGAVSQIPWECHMKRCLRNFSCTVS